MSACARTRDFSHDALGPAGVGAEPAAVKENNQWNYVKTTERSLSSCDTTPGVIKICSFSVTQFSKSLQNI